MIDKRLRSFACAGAIVAFVMLATGVNAQAGKPGGGEGGTTYTYSLTDLLGFPSNGYQSRPYFITNRDQPAEEDPGSVLVCGVSRLYPEPGPAEFHPALWRMAADGSFPESDPRDLGLPPWSREARVGGLSEMEVVAVSTDWARYQDPDDTYWDGEKYVARWMFPAYLDVPGWGYLQLPTPQERSNLPFGVRYRNSSVNGMNNNHVIIGSHDVLLEVASDGTEVWGGVNAVWQLVITTGEISPPVSLGTFLPMAINNYDVVAGLSQEGYMAIGWFETKTQELHIINVLETPRSLGASVAAINDCAVNDPRLTVVGTSWANEAGQYQQPDSRRGLIWRPNQNTNTTTVIGTLLNGSSSTALDVNLSGDVVGWSDTKRDGHHAFVYSGGALSDLNAKVALDKQTLNWATGINDDGDIIGFMGIPRPISEQRGFLLRPIPK